MKFRSTTGKSSRRRASQVSACVRAAPISNASFFELSGASSGFEPASPGQELALRSDPVAQLLPTTEDRLVRDLGVDLAGLGRGNDQQAVGMIGELADQPPFLVRELETPRAPPGRLLVVAHGGKLQGEDPAQLVLGIRMGGDEGIGTVNQHSA